MLRKSGDRVLVFEADAGVRKNRNVLGIGPAQALRWDLGAGGSSKDRLCLK